MPSGTSESESRAWCQRVREHGVSSCHLLARRCIAVELTEQAITVLLGRLGKLLNEAFDLLTSGIFEDFGTAEVDGIGFHQFGIEFVLADDLAEPVADLVTSTPIAVPVSVGILGRKLTLIGSRWHRTRIRSDLLDRADSDAIRLAQGTIDGSGFGYPHLGAADQQRNIGRIGVAIADETGGIFGRINRCLEHESIRRGITQRINSLNVDTAASLATRQPNKSGMGHEPAILKLDHISTRERKAELFGQLF